MLLLKLFEPTLFERRMSEFVGDTKKLKHQIKEFVWSLDFFGYFLCQGKK
jgi:hypothetical protein